MATFRPLLNILLPISTFHLCTFVLPCYSPYLKIWAQRRSRRCDWCDCIPPGIFIIRAFQIHFKKEKQKLQQTNLQTNYNKLCYKKKCNIIDIPIYYRYNLSSSVFSLSWIICKIYTQRSYTLIILNIIILRVWDFDHKHNIK